jgi:hypothetical protein
MNAFMKSSLSKIAVAVFITNALLLALLPALADERANRVLSEKIYGAGRAALLWPDDEVANEATTAPESVNGRYLSSYEGLVSHVRARDYFDFRAADGRSYRVVAQDDNARWDISTNQRVRVRGHLAGDILIANSVRPVGYSGNRRVDFPGTVTSIIGVSRLTVRGDNTRTYTIDMRSRLPYGLSAGDYVRIEGNWDGYSVVANQITILSDGHNGGGTADRPVDFPGMITDVDRNRNTLSVRGENGLTYTVSYNGSDRFTNWERVRVVGYFDGYNVRATLVTRR